MSGIGTLELIVDASGTAEVICYWGAEQVGDTPDQFSAEEVFTQSVERGLDQKVVFRDLPRWKRGSAFPAVVVARGTAEDSAIRGEVTYLDMTGNPPELTVSKVSTIQANHASISYKTIDLYDGVQKSLELSECVVCLENPADTAILWCGHLCLCRSCAQVRNSSWSWMCAICRSAVRGTVQIQPNELERLKNDRQWSSS
jgi:hypothetical protein